MRKCVLLIISTILLFSSLLNVDAAQLDINRNDEISTSDARMILQHTIGSISLTAYQQALGDYDRDGICTTTDARFCLLASISKTPLAIQSTTFNVNYIDIADSIISDATPSLLTNKTEWDSFVKRHPNIEPPLFYESQTQLYNDMFFESNTIVAIPFFHEDAYIAEVATNDTTIYISRIILSDHTISYGERTAFALVIIDDSVTLNKAIQVTDYIESVNITLPSKATNIITTRNGLTLKNTNNTGKYDYSQPLILESVADCRAFVDEHTIVNKDIIIEGNPLIVAAPITMDDFSLYDEAFFESNILILNLTDPNDYNFSSAVISQHSIHKDHIFVTINYKYYKDSYSFMQYWTDICCVAVSRNDYAGQKISFLYQTRCAS